MLPARVLRSAIVLKPSTLLHFHRMLAKRKYRMLFTPKHRRQPGPKGPKKDLIGAVVEMKRRNPTWGCPRIAQQITLTFGVDINKDVVRRILGMHYLPESVSSGPSWLTFLGQAKDSLWSADLFRCESVSLRTHWVAGGDGPVHAPRHRIWHSPWNCRRIGIVSDVSASDSAAIAAEVPQHRQ
jgi:hypothetical protein